MPSASRPPDDLSRQVPGPWSVRSAGAGATAAASAPRQPLAPPGPAPRAAPATASLAAPLAAQPMAGVEVKEFDSDTVFDRFFGPQAPSAPGRFDRR